MRPSYNIDKAIEVAHAAAFDSLQESIRSIDSTLGEGYARKNPYLVSTLVKASVAVFGAMIEGGLVEGTAQNKQNQ